MKKMFFVLLLFIPQGHAEDFLLSAGMDVGHADGVGLVSGRYGDGLGVSLGLFTHRDWNDNICRYGKTGPDMLAGVDYRFRSGRWTYGLGGVWIDKTNRINGTKLNFDLSLGYDFSARYSLTFRHMSHFKAVGVEEDRPNAGWNFLGLAVRF